MTYTGLLSDDLQFEQSFYQLKKDFHEQDNQHDKPIEEENEQSPYKANILFAGYMDLPPGINGSYKPGSDKHPIVSTKELQQFKQDASKLLSQGYHDYALINAIRQTPRKVPLRVDLHFFFKTMWRQDIDGGIKAALDATFARLELNDNLVVDLSVSKRVDLERPRAEIEVYCALPTMLSR